MPHYKDPENKLHFIDDESFAHLLPPGCVKITDEEAEALRPVPTIDRAAEIKAELAAIDMKSIRALREGDTARISALESQAQALRDELRAL